MTSRRPSRTVTSRWALIAFTDDASDLCVLDLCGFKLSGSEAEAYCTWCSQRAKEVKRHAKQHERWSKLLRETAWDVDLLPFLNSGTFNPDQVSNMACSSTQTLDPEP